MSPPTTSEEAGILVIRFDDPQAMNDGRSDHYRRSLYELLEARPGPPRVAADLGPVDYLSSSGVALLVGLKRRVDAQKGKLVLFQIQPYVADVLRVTRLSQFFVIAEDRRSALALLSAPPA
jgi:anti-sigma B factor antagonist